jgi:serine/threonine-protein kinase
MGEVYRARDTRLDRTVAVKVLPLELAADPQLKARFEREARAISALAHPNVCTLHDVGQQDGRMFLVMEHLAGETLAERLKRGPLPLDQALEIATQIADALAAAHKQDIVHRDLKPGNVMLTRAGVKLLDFGLARLTAHGDRPAVESVTSAPTKQAPLTAKGTILGTLPYMAPEQVEGKPADPRTDLWALGTILYEMVTGHRAFEAASPVSLIGAILEREPAPLRERQPLTPPSLERLVRRCLAKDPEERWDTAHDVADELRWVAEAAAAARTEAPRTAVGPLRSTVLSLAALSLVALLVGALAGWWWRGGRDGAHPAAVVRSEIDLAADRPLVVDPRTQRIYRRELDLSADGTLLVWSSSGDEDPWKSALYLRRMDSGDVLRLPGTEGAVQPFFSPDGRWVGFFERKRFRGTRLRKVPVDGGPVVDLSDNLPGPPLGASWAPDGKILFGGTQGIRSVPAEGGPLSDVTIPEGDSDGGHFLPWVLPHGRALLFTQRPTHFSGRARIEALRLASGERTIVVDDAIDARYLPTGHLIFMRRGVLMAAPFDPERLELRAPPVPVLEGVSQAVVDVEQAGLLAVSHAGLLVYAAGGVYELPPIRLLLLDETGRTDPLPGFERGQVSPQVDYSPDGRQLAFVDRSPSGLLWLFDLERHTYRALSNRGIAGAPRWSPDGSRLVVSWSETGLQHLWVLPATGGEWERLTEGARPDFSPSWSPDGSVVAFSRWGPPSHDIFVYRFEDRQALPFLDTEANEFWPEFSPDGRWLAYASDESGRLEVYVTSFPGREHTLTVSRDGGMAPAWSTDGTRLFYPSLPSPDGPRSLMVVAVRREPTLSLGQPAALYPLPERFLGSMGVAPCYDFHPDGRRVLIGVWGEDEGSAPITRLTLVHNWFAELERVAPTD